MSSKDPNRKGIRFSDEELALFTATMKRDGMSQLTTWMKSVCSRYATGQLVQRSELIHTQVARPIEYFEHSESPSDPSRESGRVITDSLKTGSEVPHKKK